MISPIRVVVVDDHMVLREGLATLVRHQDDVELVGQAASLDEARSIIAEQKPDVAIVDLALGPEDGLTLVRELGAGGSTRAVVLTMLEDEEHARLAMAFGAMGYALKRSSSRSLLDAIRAAMRGERYLDPTFGPDGLRRIAARRPVAAGLATLTPRERQVLELVASGYTHREIAERLGIGKKSIDTYRARVYSKLGIGTRAELVRAAIEAGLFSRELASAKL